jgi:hypothetical protein
MSEQDAVLFANSAFYAAFAGRDPAAMEEVWAKDRSLTCVHPGWAPLSGRAEVLASWRAILSGNGAPRIRCCQERAAIYGACAVVSCIEVITSGQGAEQYLAATNIFIRTGSIWVMVHHQAGAANVDPRTLESDTERPKLN